MATATRKAPGAATPATRKATPPDTCRMTITIRGVAYSARPIPNPDGRAYRLRRLDTGEVYDVAEGEWGPCCDCADAAFRRDGTGTSCKHVRALAALGLLDLTRESDPRTWPAWTDGARYSTGGRP